MREYERQNTDLTEASASPYRPDVAAGGTSRDPEQIQLEIERTRERMARDVDAIGHRLSPRNIAQGAVDSMGWQARATGSRMFDFIREHPLQVAAVGLGVTWLMSMRSAGEVSGDRMARYAYTGPDRRSGAFRRRGEIGSRVGEIGSEARETVASAASSVSERAGELKERAQERAEELSQRVSERAGMLSHRAGQLKERAQERVGRLGDRTRWQATRARSGFERMLEENPLAVAAGAAVFGLALGLLLPESERENTWLGPTRDRLIDRAGDAAERVKDAATEAAREVKQSVQEEWAERKPELQNTVQEAAQNVKEQVKDAASKVKEETKDAVRTKGSSRPPGV
jgi:ElaB/YqjD/DUF883 family membrane-anchored ribosome-binding protein